jgi:hypothetical protein
MNCSYDEVEYAQPGDMPASTCSLVVVSRLPQPTRYRLLPTRHSIPVIQVSMPDVKDSFASLEL